jgi:hypothetical protein
MAEARQAKQRLGRGRCKLREGKAIPGPKQGRGQARTEARHGKARKDACRITARQGEGQGKDCKAKPGKARLGEDRSMERPGPRQHKANQGVVR